MRILLTLSLVIAVTLLGGCANAPSQSNKLEGGYRLTSLQNNDIPQNIVILIRVGEGTLSGKGPVNQWSAQIQDGQVGGMISTRMAGSPALMQIEAQLFDALIESRIKSNGNERIIFVKKKQTVAEALLIEPSANR